VGGSRASVSSWSVERVPPPENRLPGWDDDAQTISRGRPRKTGRQVVEDAARTILGEGQILHNPKAESVDLGPCILGKGIGQYGEGGRPRKQVTGNMGNRGGWIQFAAMAYHITWVANEKRACPGTAGFGY